MSTRDLAKFSTPGQEVADLRRYLEQLRDNPLLRGQLAEGTMRNGDNIAFVPHSLGYAYSGAVIVSVDQVGVADSYVVLPPQSAVRMYQAKPDREVAIVMGPLPATRDTALSLWVF